SSASPHTTAFSTLSLHDALPISNRCGPDKLLWQSLFHLHSSHSDTPRDDSEKRHPRAPASTVPAYFPGSRNPGASRPKQQPPHVARVSAPLPQIRTAHRARKRSTLRSTSIFPGKLAWLRSSFLHRCRKDCASPLMSSNDVIPLASANAAPTSITRRKPCTNDSLIACLSTGRIDEAISWGI